MPVNYFRVPYQQVILNGVRSRESQIVSLSSVIAADDGDYALAEIDGDQAICKVRASGATLANIALVFQQITPASVWTPTYKTWQRMPDGTLALHPTNTNVSKSLVDLEAEVLNDSVTDGARSFLLSAIATVDRGDVVVLPTAFSVALKSYILRRAFARGYGLNRIKPGTFPTTGILDNFNRADAQTLGGDWRGNTISLPSGTNPDQAIISNTVGVATDSSAVALSYGTSSYGPDAEAYITLTSQNVGDEVYVMVRVDNPGTTYTGYMGSAYSGGFRLRRVDNGTPTTLDLNASAPLNGDKLGLEAIGSTISVYRYTSGAWGLMAWASDSTYSTSGRIGCYFPGTSGAYALDDFGGGTIGNWVTLAWLKA